METWKDAPDRPGYRRKIIQRGQATIIIERPILDAAAAAKAEKRTRNELEHALRDHCRRAARPA